MKLTKIFFDTEFTGLRQRTTLISIGLISECGKTFYAEVMDYDKFQVDRWIQENVIDKLILNDWAFGTKVEGDNTKVKCSLHDLRYYISQWLGQFEQVEMWSDCLAYDWVLFCNIFGSAFNVPENVYYIPFDICTLFKFRGIDPDISREKYAFGEVYAEMLKMKHNALADAKIIKMCHDKLMIAEISAV